jgi:hypothetical protein
LSETPFESPAEDVAEQRTEVVSDEQAEADRAGPENGRWPAERWDADPADAAEQAVEVPIDEDEWR